MAFLWDCDGWPNHAQAISRPGFSHGTEMASQTMSEPSPGHGPAVSSSSNPRPRVLNTRQNSCEYYAIAVAVVAQTKADQAAAELSQVLRKERAGQARIADAQSEAEELRGEMDSMKETFSRSAPC